MPPGTGASVLAHLRSDILVLGPVCASHAAVAALAIGRARVLHITRM